MDGEQAEGEEGEGVDETMIVVSGHASNPSMLDTRRLLDYSNGGHHERRPLRRTKMSR